MKNYVIFAIICFSLVFGVGAYKTGTLSNYLPINKVIPEPINTFNEPELPLPNSGIYNLLTDKKLIAPLTISSDPAGSNIYLKFEDSETNSIVMTIFIKYGETINIKVPLGKYLIKVASGGKWYGNSYLFGPNTNYSEVRDLITFYQNGDQIMGHTIDFKGSIDGNLPTDNINKNDW